MLKFIFFCFFIFSFSFLFSQTLDEVDSSFCVYDKYNATLGAEGVRMCNNRPCNGIIKDFYDDGSLKHKAYYENGQMKNGFENFYDNEQVERRFTVLSSNTASLLVYYPSGILRSRVFYKKMNPLKWEDFYPDGKVEFIEEYDNKFEYYLMSNFYYSNGNPQAILEIVDKKERIYSSKEYYENGNLKSEGKRLLQMASGNYAQIEEWKFFDENGNLVRTENYYKGELLEE